jgi:cysteine-rich repeat protein
MAGWCFSYTCLRRLTTFWSVVKVASSNTVHFADTTPQSLRLHLPTAQGQDKIIVKIYYQSAMRLQVFVGSTFVEDVNSLDGKSKAQLVRDGHLSPNDAQGGYTDQHIDLTQPCNIGGLSADVIKCMTPSNEHGANRFNRAEQMLEIVVAAHDPSSYIEIRTLPVVAVRMGVSGSGADFYKVKDSFMSNLAFVLGIDVKRITIVDVVAGNARRRRNLLGTSATVNFEVEPSPVIELYTSAVTILENVATVTVQVKRSVNILGVCGVSYSVANMSSDTGMPSVNFVAKSGYVSFKSTEVTQEITVEILSEAGYREEDVYFTLTISNAQNATLGATQMTVIAVRNVHMPAPAAPMLAPSGTSSTAIMVAWSPASWPAAPSEALNTTLAWDLECRHPEVAPTDFRKLPVPFASLSISLFGGLSTYRRVQCRIRVQAAGGWSLWSALSSDMYTLPVCGDGVRHGTEQCDDAGTTGGDGCSSVCSVEAGYACSTTPSGVDACNNGCANGTVEAGELCDDGNAGDQDGCDGSCRIERGWNCSLSPHSTISGAKRSACDVMRGDGFRVSGREACDDGNAINGDGCSIAMAIESGFSCSEDSSGKSTCKKCGNGVLEGDEACDDADLSKACLGCNSVKPGWVCTGTACSAGPARVTQPVLSSAQELSLQVRWTAPNSYGLAILSYVVQWLNASSNDWGRAASATVSPSVVTYTINNLTSSTSYRSRVRACNAEGCGAYSNESTALSTLQRVVALEEIGEKVGSAVATAASSSGIPVQNGSIVVVKPPPEPQAPPPSTVNETAAQQAAEKRAEEQHLLALAQQDSEYAIGFYGTVQDMTVLESHGKIIFPIQLVRKSDGSTNHDGSLQAVRVQWEMVSNGAVVAPNDVSKTSGFVVFSPGQVNKSLEIDIVDNTAINYNRASKRFELKLRSLGGSSVLESRSQVTVTIIDNDDPSSVALTPQVSVKAGAIAQISFTRTTWMDSALKLKFKIQDVTAKAKEDYSQNNAVEATLGAGAAAGSISIQTINAQRGKEIKFNVVLEVVQSECEAGDGQFLCTAVITANTAVVTIEPVACGDGVRGSGEICDDNNAVSEDGCSDKCSVEPGFVCDPSFDKATGKAGGYDVCTPPKTPPQDSVFLKAKAKMEGITAADFVGVKRKIFRHSIAESANVAVSNVVITMVTTFSARRAGAQLEVSFQVQVPETDKDKVAQAVVNAAADGSLSKSLKRGGLDVKVSAISPPDFVKSDGSSGQVGVVIPTPESGGNVAIIIIAVVVAICLLLCVFIAVCFLFRKKKKLEPCVSKVGSTVDDSKVVDVEGENMQKETEVMPKWATTRAPPKLLSEEEASGYESDRVKPMLPVEEDTTAGGRTAEAHAPASALAEDLELPAEDAVAERQQTSDPNDVEELFEQRQAMKPLWGQIVDDFVTLGETAGRFLSEDQIVSIVHEAYDRALKTARSVGDMKGFIKIDQSEFPRLLQSYALQSYEAVAGSAEGTTDYRSFCEMMAPDLLSRRAFLLFCALRETTSKGVCVAELQHALMLGHIAPDYIAALSGFPELKYPSTVEEPVRQRILFSQILASLEHVAAASNPKHSDPRRELERCLQASCDAMMMAASFSDLATHEASSTSIPKRLSTGRHLAIVDDNADSAGDSAQSEVRVFGGVCRPYRKCCDRCRFVCGFMCGMSLLESHDEYIRLKLNLLGGVCLCARLLSFCWCHVGDTTTIQAGAFSPRARWSARTRTRCTYTHTREKARRSRGGGEGRWEREKGKQSRMMRFQEIEGARGGA